MQGHMSNLQFVFSKLEGPVHIDVENGDIHVNKVRGFVIMLSYKVVIS